MKDNKKIKSVKKIVDLLTSKIEENYDLGITLAKSQNLEREVVDGVKLFVDEKIGAITKCNANITSYSVKLGYNVEIDMEIGDTSILIKSSNIQLRVLIHFLFEVAKNLDTPIFQSFEVPNFNHCINHR